MLGPERLRVKLPKVSGETPGRLDGNKVPSRVMAAGLYLHLVPACTTTRD
jgi:hypothetical protein